MTSKRHQRVCIYCGADFLTNHNGQKLCDTKCSNAIKARRKRERRLVDKDKLNTQAKIRRQESPLKYLLYSAKSRALSKNIEFDLSEEDLTIPEKCPALDINIISDGERSGNSPSLDRIDNTKGYISGNVAVISDRANRIKNDSTILELESVIKYMSRHILDTLFIPVKPTPASRPRISRYGNYYPKSYTDYRKATYQYLKKLKDKYSVMDGTYQVYLEFICYRPKKPSNSYPRGDCDNHQKAILDSITYAQIFWKDDDVITKITAEKRYQKEDEQVGTIISVMRIGE